MTTASTKPGGSFEHLPNAASTSPRFSRLILLSISKLAASKRSRSRSIKRRFQVALIKPSHYDDDGYVIQWLRSFIPSNSLAAVHGLVEDNGRGFVVAERNNLPGHLGLLAFKERALMLGGWYKIESQPGAGTKIEFWMPTGPLDEEA